MKKRTNRLHILSLVALLIFATFVCTQPTAYAVNYTASHMTFAFPQELNQYLRTGTGDTGIKFFPNGSGDSVQLSKNDGETLIYNGKVYDVYSLGSEVTPASDAAQFRTYLKVGTNKTAKIKNSNPDYWPTSAANMIAVPGNIDNLKDGSQNALFTWAQHYKITLDANGGTAGSKTSFNIVKDEDMPALTSTGELPTKQGFTFNGFFDAATDGTKYYNADGTSAKKWDKTSANTTLYAQWTPDSTDPKFYAVFNTNAEGKSGEAGYKPANTLSIYYDTNKASHIGVSGKNVYSDLPTEATKKEDWGYNAKRYLVKNVVIDAGVANYSGLKSTAYMFSDMDSADDISGCEYLDVSNVTNMSNMFSFFGLDSKSLTVVPNVSDWNTVNVTDMSYMFNRYGKSSTAKLQALDLSKWSISSLTKTERMFSFYAYANTLGDPVVYAANWSSAKTLNANNSMDMFTDSKLRNANNVTSASDQWAFANTGATGCFTVETPPYAVSADFNFTPPTESTYDGTVKSAEVKAKSGITGMGEVTVKYSSDGGKNWSQTAKNAGTYIVKIDVAEGEDYASTTDITDSSWTFTIEKAKLTVSGTTVESKTYDGNATATVKKGTLAGVIGADDVSIDTTTGTFEDKNAGETKEVTVSYTLKGVDTDNYEIDTETVNADISKKVLTVSGTTVENKTYDGNTTATVKKGTLAGVIGADDVSIDAATGTFEDKNAGEAKEVTVSYNLSGDDAGNYVVEDEKSSATITKRDITLNSADAIKEYDRTPLTNHSVAELGSGFVAGEGATYNYIGSQTFVGKSDNIFTYTLNEGTKADNYDITTENGNLEVCKKALKIYGITASDKVYDGTETATISTANAIFEGIAPCDTLTVSTTGVFADKNAGENKTVTFSGLVIDGDAKDNYIIDDNSQKITEATIYKKELTVVAGAKLSYVNRDLEKLTYTSEGLLEGDTISGELETNADNKIAGEYDITIGTLSAGDNYTITFIPAKYTILRRRSSGSTKLSTVKVTTNIGDDESVLSVSVGKKVSSIQTPTMDKKNFIGWYADEDLTTPVSENDIINEDTSLYAGFEWDSKYTLNMAIGKKEAVAFGESVTNDVAPIIRNDRTMLPARFVAENLGAKVEWEEATQTVTITSEDGKTVIKLVIGSNKAFVNGQEIILDSAAFIENDRTYTPVRFVAEALGATVEWVDKNQEVIIIK